MADRRAKEDAVARQGDEINTNAARDEGDRTPLRPSAHEAKYDLHPSPLRQTVEVTDGAPVSACALAFPTEPQHLQALVPSALGGALPPSSMLSAPPLPPPSSMLPAASCFDSFPCYW